MDEPAAGVPATRTGRGDPQNGPKMTRVTDFERLYLRAQKELDKK